MVGSGMPDTSESLREAIGRIRTLPTLPSIMFQLFETVSDPDASALDLGRLIVADQSLSAALLRVVNSAYYGFYRQIFSVTDAVVILGFAKVRDIALAATAFERLTRVPSPLDRPQLWRHSLATAMAAERIARLASLAPAKGHFCAGLLHDLGKVVLSMVHPEAFGKASALARESGMPLWMAEEQALGFNHATAGAALAEHWELPVHLVEAVRLHHHPEQSECDAATTHVTALANYAAHEAGVQDGVEPSGVEMPALSGMCMGIEELRLGEVIADIAGARGRIDVLLGLLPS